MTDAQYNKTIDGGVVRTPPHIIEWRLEHTREHTLLRTAADGAALSLTCLRRLLLQDLAEMEQHSSSPVGYSSEDEIEVCLVPTEVAAASDPS